MLEHSEDCRQVLSKKAVHELCHVVEDVPAPAWSPSFVSQSLSCQSTAAILGMYHVKSISWNNKNQIIFSDICVLHLQMLAKRRNGIIAP